ncbi:uncharacterized protein NEMAJ01_0525 [Nematocida major]|uniref:uncharacterized protein n=1 Tax=Nematocida major TaxID=1912982 RepID=UPI00200871CE|nr:uncharacterized protein NEMAJ01_0525 [Nematocida major]KAH9385629.1 hypothetical protein NEMAJ01_0525 [Nematocida major]
MNLVKFTTTGLSSLEKGLISKAFEGTQFVLSDTMGSGTSYVLAYRSKFTEKRILAEKWAVPVISVLWVYKSMSIKNIMQFRLRKYEGCTFCTSGITNDLFINYYRLGGACHSSVLTRHCDFLVVNSVEQVSDKILYAKECNIPVISAENVFDDRVEFFRRSVQYESFVNEPLTDEIFNGKTFYFEGDTAAHMLVRRIVIEYGGNRVERPGPDVSYSIHFGGAMKKGTLVWYQWILDSADLGILLSPDGYLVDRTELPPRPLEKAVVFPMVCKEEGLRTRNKVHALGGEIAMQMNSKITHCVVERKSKQMQNRVRNYLKVYKINVCFLEWLNQSIYYMKRLNEEKFEMPTGLKTLPEVVIEKKETRRKASIKYMPSDQTGWKVQFTGMVDKLKEKAMRVLGMKGVVVIDSPEYASECTHLIVGTVTVSLKLLSAVSSGCILMDYRIVDDLLQNIYTKESDYELGLRDLKLDAPKNEKVIRRLISAASIWRAKKTESGKRAFSGWSVVILVTKDKEILEKLIENGGGRIVKENLEINTHINTLYFVDAATIVPAEASASKIIYMKDIIMHLAGIKHIE